MYKEKKKLFRFIDFHSYIVKIYLDFPYKKNILTEK